jgi:hypothetical protein
MPKRDKIKRSLIKVRDLIVTGISGSWNLESWNFYTASERLVKVKSRIFMGGRR